MQKTGMTRWKTLGNESLEKSVFLCSSTIFLKCVSDSPDKSNCSIHFQTDDRLRHTIYNFLFSSSECACLKTLNIQLEHIFYSWMVPVGKLKQQDRTEPLIVNFNAHLRRLNETLFHAKDRAPVRSYILDNTINSDLRVVPVESQPVQAFELVFPECIAIPVFSGALQLFPVGCRRPILDTSRNDTRPLNHRGSLIPTDLSG